MEALSLCAQSKLASHSLRENIIKKTISNITKTVPCDNVCVNITKHTFVSQFKIALTRLNVLVAACKNFSNVFRHCLQWHGHTERVTTHRFASIIILLSASSQIMTEKAFRRSLADDCKTFKCFFFSEIAHCTHTESGIIHSVSF